MYVCEYQRNYIYGTYVTLQVVCALLAQKLIVTVQYVEDLVNAVSNKTKHPDPNESVLNYVYLLNCVLYSLF